MIAIKTMAVLFQWLTQNGHLARCAVNGQDARSTTLLGWFYGSESTFQYRMFIFDKNRYKS
jgi:hypothetical protein